MGAQDELQPDAVATPPVEREVGQAGGLGGADAVLDPGALAVPQLQGGEVAVGLVGYKDLEAVAVVVGEAQLGAGVGVLTAADHPGARRPGVQVDPAGQLAHLGASADRPAGSTAGVQAASGWARIASRTWASICMPSENPTRWSRRRQASRVLAPALSLRTSTDWSVVGSCARARSTSSISHHCHRLGRYPAG